MASKQNSIQCQFNSENETNAETQLHGLVVCPLHIKDRLKYDKYIKYDTKDLKNNSLYIALKTY